MSNKDKKIEELEKELGYVKKHSCFIYLTKRWYNGK